jgi:hypothetical protein
MSDTDIDWKYRGTISITTTVDKAIGKPDKSLCLSLIHMN